VTKKKSKQQDEKHVSCFDCEQFPQCRPPDELARLRREARMRVFLMLEYYGWTDQDEC